ncbi:hypothetical protein [Cytobacillus firmus]|uniref:hypothetical protein n=1 Tax=Cytobacillus firmus TaxID=1399 RepID=UPI0034A45524
MGININSDLIDSFRNKVNEEPFFSEIYKNVNGKNHWNLLCSAMDWITVASNGLPEINLNPKGMGYNHIQTINLMQYIVTIDILVESIIQIFRVLDPGNPYPLAKNKDIFKHEKLSDDIYFKHIRAVFSTHPVNLSSLDGVKRNDGERFFASWVSQNGLDDDYHVFLYSNDPEKDDTNSFGIRLTHINCYATIRYELLKQLTHLVDTIIKKHIDDYSKKVIPTVDTVIDQLDILYKENEKRFGKSYGYSYSITYLKRLFETEIEMFDLDDEFTTIFNYYKDHMLIGVSKIKEGLQRMSDDDFYIRHKASGYEFEKIYSYFSDGIHPIGKKYFQGLIYFKKLPSKLIEIDDMWLNQLMLDALLFSLCEETGKDRIKLNEIVEIIYP